MARLTVAEVDRIALLARLDLTDEEKTLYADQLSAVLEYAAELNGIDVEGIAPTASVLDICNVMRTGDAAISGLARSQALANAPRTDGASFEVQATLDHDE